ncbi:DUF523 domain-containing protein [Robertmurraya sp. FSL R5-0851]|jgi:uncharacterized protein YbbK (DUF523 family)|uniref:DUF523 domain-containing protein n=1 Tax=Robertmurraya sp. FSL R5-0851 TaxID=2921584 RepID=UPI0030FB59BF
MIIVSACLAGFPVRYNGLSSLDEKVHKLVSEKTAITVCPELLGGLETPREPAEIVGGVGEDVLDGKAKVIDCMGKDVTEAFVQGAYETLNVIKKIQATVVVLKENSPSCGSGKIYDGTFTGEKVEGHGVTAALLIRNGVKVITETQFLKEY